MINTSNGPRHVLHLTNERLDVVAQALEMWIGNEHDDMHESEPDAERAARVRDAEVLHAELAKLLENAS